MKLRLSSSFAVDTDDYQREGLRFSILAMSGHGKSNAAADIVEDVLDNGAQVIIIEPIPEWHTLKARYNNVVVVGGPYQDLPLEPGFAHEYVKAALEKGISLVVNVSDIEDDADQIKFVSSFLWNLYRLEQKYRRVVFLVLEEADIWAPQQWDAVTKPSLSRVSLIAKHGRKIGIFPILISQRPADLHKRPLSQCNVNLFGKFTSPADLNPRTGIMYVVKKQHFEITEQQIMQLETGHFVVTDKMGVHTVVVRKRLCPHGADTPLVEAKPFTADLSNALGGLRDEITKALEAKKAEESQVKRLEQQVSRLKEEKKDLEAKANIKLAVKEMLQGAGSEPAKLAEKIEALETEKTDLNKKLDEANQRIQELQGVAERLEKAKQDLELFNELKAIYTKILPTNVHTDLPTSMPAGDSNPATVGLQRVITVVDLEEIKKTLPKVPTDTVKGKILQLAKAGFLDGWKSAGEISSALVDKFAFNASDQAINGALKDLVNEQILGMKHTDRNRWKLAPDVVFEKEVKPK